MEYKNWNKLVNIIKKRFIDMENEVVVTCGERKEAKSNKGIRILGQGDPLEEGMATH